MWKLLLTREKIAMGLFIAMSCTQSRENHLILSIHLFFILPYLFFSFFLFFLILLFLIFPFLPSSLLPSFPLYQLVERPQWRIQDARSITKQSWERYDTGVTGAESRDFTCGENKKGKKWSMLDVRCYNRWKRYSSSVSLYWFVQFVTHIKGLGSWILDMDFDHQCSKNDWSGANWMWGRGRILNRNNSKWFDDTHPV